MSFTGKKQTGARPLQPRRSWTWGGAWLIQQPGLLKRFQPGQADSCAWQTSCDQSSRAIVSRAQSCLPQVTNRILLQRRMPLTLILRRQTVKMKGTMQFRHPGWKALPRQPPDSVRLAGETDVAAAACRLIGSLSLRRSAVLHITDGVGTSAEAQRFASHVELLKAARDRMIRSNLRLVISIARRYFHSGLPMSDLVQEGNLGLVDAVDKYDWRRGFRFSTMATWWIRQRVYRAIAETALQIRLPVHAYEIASQMPRLLSAQGLPKSHAPAIDFLAGHLDLAHRKTEWMLRAVSEPLSLDVLDEEHMEPADGADPFAAVARLQMVRTMDEVPWRT